MLQKEGNIGGYREPLVMASKLQTVVCVQNSVICSAFFSRIWRNIVNITSVPNNLIQGPLTQHILSCVCLDTPKKLTVSDDNLSQRKVPSDKGKKFCASATPLLVDHYLHVRQASATRATTSPFGKFTQKVELLNSEIYKPNRTRIFSILSFRSIVKHKACAESV